jgi:hypothetical protein
MLTRKSRVISKLNQLLAILGATLRRLGPIPLKSPRMPSSATISRTASQIEAYLYPIPDMVLIWKRRRRTSLEKKKENLLAQYLNKKGTIRESLQWICASLSHGAGYSTCQQSSGRTGVLLSVRGKVLAHRLVSHEIQADLQILSAPVYHSDTICQRLT